MTHIRNATPEGRPDLARDVGSDGQDVPLHSRGLDMGTTASSPVETRPCRFPAEPFPQVRPNVRVQERARIRQFIEGDREVKAPQSEVDAYIQRVQDTDGAPLVYLYNYKQGSPDRGGDSPTQSMHFDIAAARAFTSVLDAALRPL